MLGPDSYGLLIESVKQGYSHQSDYSSALIIKATILN
jgi:hypothetical protein